MLANAEERWVEYDGKLVPPQAWWGGEPPSGAESLFLGSSGVLGPWVAGLQLMWGQVGSWASALSHGLVFPPPRTISFIVLFSQYLKDVSVPLPSYQRGKKCHLSPVYLFQIFPVGWGFWRPGDRGRGILLTLPGLPGLFPLLSSRISASQASLRGEGAEGEKVPTALTVGREGRREGHQDPLPPFHVPGKGSGGEDTLSPPNCAGDAAVP